MRRRFTVLGMVLACTLGAAHETPLAAARDNPPGPTQMRIHNVVLYGYDDAPARVAEASGTMVPTRRGRTAALDDVTSYGVRIGHAQVQFGAATLTALVNRAIAPSADGAIRRLEVRFDAGALVLTGAMVQAGKPAPFAATAVPQPTAGGIELRIVAVTDGELVARDLVDAVGTQLAATKPDAPTPLRIVRGALVMPLDALVPPLTFTGKLRAVQVTPDDLVAIIGMPGDDATAKPAADSYIQYHGGALQVGRLTMRDADLTLLPKPERPRLTLSLAHSYRQMAAGFAVPQPSQGLVAYVADYGELLAGGHLAAIGSDARDGTVR